ncbi:MAG: mechanosensitive ion channel [Inquilinus sp.]|nr:mechanosensitive ion channel [Inquilinus sp.]
MLHPSCRCLPSLLAGLLLVLAVAAGAPTMAQEGAAPPAETSAEQMDDLIRTLEDDAERARLIEQLRLLAGARAAADDTPARYWDSLGATVLAYLSAQSAAIGEQANEVAAAVAELPSLLAWIGDELDSPAAQARWRDVLTNLAIIVGSSLAGLWLVALPLRRRRKALERRATETALGRVLVNLAAVTITLVPLVVFALVAYVALTLIDPRQTTRIVVLAFVNGILVRGIIVAAARVVLSPTAGSRRLLALGDETAAYLYVWSRRLATIGVFGWVVAETGLVLGMTDGARDALLDLVGLLIAGMLMVLVAQNRRTLADALQRPRHGRPVGVLRRRFAEIWHVLAFAYIVVVYGIWLLDIDGGAAFALRATVLSALVLLAVLALFAGMDRMMTGGLAFGDDLKAQFPGLEARANRYLPLLVRAVKAVVVVVAGLAVLEAWDLGGFAFLSSDAGRGVAGRVTSIAVALLLAVVVWEAISGFVERRLSGVDEDGNPIAQSSRARTLLPLLRKAAFVVLMTFIALIVLSEIGVNIAPLLAGAGIVGLAVGFGAQTLVKDIITGLFILIEDTIAVGDVVEVGGHSGLVEALSLRTISLRDLSGSVHTVPFSEVTTVLNRTKDFSFYVMDIGVAYREDADQVIEVLKQLGAEILEDPAYAQQILEPIEILGVDAFADSAVIIKARIKTKPIKQWFVGREFNRRMKRRFDELGIEIPFPHMTLYFGEDKKGEAPPAHLRFDADAAALLAPKSKAARPAKAASGD